MSNTQSSLSTARLCSMKFELQYNQLLERNTDDEREVLAVGHCWHRAFDARARGGDPFSSILNHAPSAVWAVKLARLFAAYDWYWRDQVIALTETEKTFRVTLNGREYEGQMDGKLLTPDRRRGILERKTTSESVGAESDYWKKLRLDVQVGLYGLAEGRPDFIVYDVVRKPTINPKNLVKIDAKRMRMELASKGLATYFGEQFTAEQMDGPLTIGEEGLLLYGARLTADIGDRPEHYFARREVPRTKKDYDELEDNLERQARTLDFLEANDAWHRNPDACHAFGTCAFFSLCANNVRPRRDEAPPEGFRRRQHRHPELHPVATKA